MHSCPAWKLRWSLTRICSSCITAFFGGRHSPSSAAMAALLRTYMTHNGLNLYAAHLRWTRIAAVGNNAELARRLGLAIVDWWANVNGVDLAVLAEAPSGTKLDYLVHHFEQTVGPVKVVLAHGPRIVHRVGILSGFGAREIEEAAALGCDTFLTGETSHAQYYDALNAGINVIYGGHYTTETVGVQALGQHLADQFGLRALNLWICPRACRTDGRRNRVFCNEKKRTKLH